jgi:hypothetical protein
VACHWAGNEVKVVSKPTKPLRYRRCRAKVVKIGLRVNTHQDGDGSK